MSTENVGVDVTTISGVSVTLGVISDVNVANSVSEASGVSSVGVGVPMALTT